MSISGAVLASLQHAFDSAAIRVNRAAQSMVQPAPAGGDVPVRPGSPPPSASNTPEDSLSSAMVDMMIAQRAFSAELRVVRSQMEMSDEAVRLGDSRATPP